MPKFTRRATERPEEILAAALESFTSTGFTASRMEEIAARAGVTAGTIYRYFANKEALVTALVDRNINAGWTRGREISEAYGTMTAREVLELLLHRWADQFDLPTNRGLLLLLIREAPAFPEELKKYVSQLIVPGCLAIERALRHGIERGEFPLLDIETTARALVSSVVAAAVWRETFSPLLSPLPAGPEPGRLAIDALVRGVPRPGENRASRADTPIRSTPQGVTTTQTTSGRLRVVTLVPPSPSS